MYQINSNMAYSTIVEKKKILNSLQIKKQV